jgi:6-phosphogluconolactonase (cycloisomerase 2 family)
MTTKVWWRAACAVGVGAAMLLTGCNGFFVHPSDGGTGTTTSGSDFAYVVNADSTVSEYEVGSGALTAVSGSPATLTSGFSVQSVAVSSQGTFAYFGGTGGTILCESIGSGGALSSTTGASYQAGTTVFSALAVSGDYLAAIGVPSAGGPVLDVFTINTSTGALALIGSATITLQQGASTVTSLPPPVVRFSPSGGLIAAAVGLGGTSVYTFNPSNTSNPLLFAASTSVAGSADNSVVFDTSGKYLYVGRYGQSQGTGSIVTFDVTTAGALAQASSVSSGDLPASLLLSSAGTYLYAANRADGTISGYTVTSASGALVPLSGSPFASVSGIQALALDSTGTYVIAAVDSGTATQDITLYQFDAISKDGLDALAEYESGTSTGSVAVATTP